MGKRVLITGLGTFWGSRVAQALEADPTVDVIVLRLADGTSAEQPLSEPWLSNVDVAARQVILNSLDGLM